MSVRPTPGRSRRPTQDRKSTRLNSSHGYISYAVFCLKKKKKKQIHSEVHHQEPGSGLELDHHTNQRSTPPRTEYSWRELRRATAVRSVPRDHPLALPP